MAPCTRDFSRALNKLQVIARNCDWFIALFSPVVIGRSYYFGIVFATVIWKALWWEQNWEWPVDVDVCGRGFKDDDLKLLSHSNIVSEGSPQPLFKAQQTYLPLYMYW